MWCYFLRGWAPTSLAPLSFPVFGPRRHKRKETESVNYKFFIELECSILGKLHGVERLARPKDLLYNIEVDTPHSTRYFLPSRYITRHVHQLSHCQHSSSRVRQRSIYLNKYRCRHTLRNIYNTTSCESRLVDMIDSCLARMPTRLNIGTKAPAVGNVSGPIISAALWSVSSNLQKL